MAKSSKPDYVGNMLLAASSPDAPDTAPVISGVAEIERKGYNISLWVAEGKDGKETKLDYSGTLTTTMDGKADKCGYIQLMKAAEDKAYLFYGWIKIKVDFDDDRPETTHMVYLYRGDMKGTLRGGIVRYEKRESSNLPGVPAPETRSKAKYEIDDDDIPF